MVKKLLSRLLIIIMLSDGKYSENIGVRSVTNRALKTENSKNRKKLVVNEI